MILALLFLALQGTILPDDGPGCAGLAAAMNFSPETSTAKQKLTFTAAAIKGKFYKNAETVLNSINRQELTAPQKAAYGFLKAKLEIQKNHSQAAYRELNDALTLEPNNPELQEAVADWFFWQGVRQDHGYLPTGPRSAAEKYEKLFAQRLPPKVHARIREKLKAAKQRNTDRANYVRLSQILNAGGFTSAQNAMIDLDYAAVIKATDEIATLFPSAIRELDSNSYLQEGRFELKDKPSGLAKSVASLSVNALDLRARAQLAQGDRKAAEATLGVSTQASPDVQNLLVDSPLNLTSNILIPSIANIHPRRGELREQIDRELTEALSALSKSRPK